MRWSRSASTTATEWSGVSYYHPMSSEFYYTEPDSLAILIDSGITVGIHLPLSYSDFTYYPSSLATYATFCQNDGDHVTQAVGSRNWNEEAITSLVLDLTDPWTNLIGQFQQKQRAIILGINAAAEEADDRLGM
jgi:hypothetical protein